MGSERVFTRTLARYFGGGSGVRIGIGDDAAVVRNHGSESVLCCDPVVENVHFSAKDPPRLVGRKAVNRNVSDLAAMGALPDWLLVSLVLPRSYGVARRRELCAGIRAAAAAASCRVVGGDVATHRGPLVVTVTAIGHLGGRALRRQDARVGDTLHVTGPLGGSRLGHHLRFTPAVREGAWLAQQRAVHAAIDVSDGLLLDLATVLEASGGLGAEVFADALPVAAAALRVAGGDREQALWHALGDGEDHALLWTQARDAQLPRGGPLTAVARRAIGRIVAEPGLWLCRGGRRKRVSALGYEHELARGGPRRRSGGDRAPGRSGRSGPAGG